MVKEWGLWHKRICCMYTYPEFPITCVLYIIQIKISQRRIFEFFFKLRYTVVNRISFQFMQGSPCLFGRKQLFILHYTRVKNYVPWFFCLRIAYFLCPNHFFFGSFLLLINKQKSLVSPGIEFLIRELSI